MNIVLVGFMASGKTSVGRRVARRLGYRFMDTDHFIESEQGCAIADIFEHQGEPHFRALESELLERLRRFDCYVFSTGGGILTTEGNLDRLRQLGLVVFLKAEQEEIIHRLQNDTRRPKVKGGDLRETVTALLAERLPQYMQADVVIETVAKTPNQVAGEVIRHVAKYKGRDKAEAPSDSSAAPDPGTTETTEPAEP